ncbi:RTA1-domain-containing protein [Epithele typhae]|uniref:RTA1-domain-containing protein n=1 Tax=Epithele typhae TaxID=378194 RepID=UPI0020083FD5|nr:RTA1-domain-containing protein [Epithele typhae]KAH9941796.1 RTA1-domain-containing protein [Epithele typhae]
MSDDNAPEFDSHGHLISPFYGYWPTEWICMMFTILFTISTLLHFGQAIHYRTRWLIYTAVLAGVGEMTGWGSRLWSSHQPLAQTPFVIQIICTICAATPLVGALFISFGQLVTAAGEQYSRLSPRLYSRIFLTADSIALFLQFAGGSIADNDSELVSKIGTYVMLGAIAFQLVLLIIFAIFAAEYLWRRSNDRPIRRAPAYEDAASHGPMETPLKHLATGICLMTLFLFIRSVHDTSPDPPSDAKRFHSGVYRTVELADGFNGRIIHTQVYFNVLDGAMVTLAMYTLNVFHTGRLLRAAAPQWTADKLPLRTVRSAAEDGGPAV